jgi:hypothetical protein
MFLGPKTTKQNCFHTGWAPPVICWFVNHNKTPLKPSSWNIYSTINPIDSSHFFVRRFGSREVLYVFPILYPGAGGWNQPRSMASSSAAAEVTWPSPTLDRTRPLWRASVHRWPGPEKMETFGDLPGLVYKHTKNWWERSTILNGEINYFDWAIFNSKL